ncbi:627_t:CDS:2 [Paraglomus brasilianum]|uniref:627_t:CDS:1 n=1 Tax=Paraglomus brasilianum TaxID=144538 RepID=A0A9N8YZU6_9GLOM|nr:627_t:CDS:2 [Paraglomus brasilianum]
MSPETLSPKTPNNSSFHNVNRLSTSPEPIRALIGTTMLASKNAVAVIVALDYSEEGRHHATVLLCTPDNLVEKSVPIKAQITHFFAALSGFL